MDIGMTWQGYKGKGKEKHKGKNNKGRGKGHKDSYMFPLDFLR